MLLFREHTVWVDGRYPIQSKKEPQIANNKLRADKTEAAGLHSLLEFITAGESVKIPLT